MTKQSSSEVEVIITLDEHHVSRLTEIAEQLSANGLKDIQPLGNIGAITGKCETSLLKKVRTISGVEAVEVSGNVQIAPPGSDIQ
jgi:hypothetical protein